MFQTRTEQSWIYLFVYLFATKEQWINIFLLYIHLQRTLWSWFSMKVNVSKSLSKESSVAHPQLQSIPVMKLWPQKHICSFIAHTGNRGFTIPKSFWAQGDIPALTTNSSFPLWSRLAVVSAQRVRGRRDEGEPKTAHFLTKLTVGF